MRRVAVVGGRGKTGRAVAAALEARGARARPLGRVELRDPQQAFAGCDAAYLIAPNMHADEATFVARLLKAAARAGVARVVYHSVAAPYVPAMPHHVGKARAELAVRHSGLSWAVLQPGVYMQNFLPALASPDPQLVVPYDPGQGYGMVDLVDLADVAAAVLLESSLDGATLEVGGPHTLSLTDLAGIAAGVLGCPVEVTQVTPAAWAETLGADLGDRERKWLLAMFAYYDAHGLKTSSLATATILGRTPTPFAEVLTREMKV